MSIIWMIIVGLIVGAVAKLIMPGDQGGGIIVTALLGIIGTYMSDEHDRWLPDDVESGHRR